MCLIRFQSIVLEIHCTGFTKQYDHKLWNISMRLHVSTSISNVHSKCKLPLVYVGSLEPSMSKCILSSIGNQPFLTCETNSLRILLSFCILLFNILLLQRKLDLSLNEIKNLMLRDRDKNRGRSQEDKILWRRTHFNWEKITKQLKRWTLQWQCVDCLRPW